MFILLYKIRVAGKPFALIIKVNNYVIEDLKAQLASLSKYTPIK